MQEVQQGAHIHQGTASFKQVHLSTADVHSPQTDGHLLDTGVHLLGVY